MLACHTGPVRWRCPQCHTGTVTPALAAVPFEILADGEVGGGVLSRARARQAGTYYPAASLYMGGHVTFNFGPDFKFPPSAGPAADARPVCELSRDSA